MPEKQVAFSAALCGALTALSENYGTICSICCALILLDLLTGLAKAKIQGSSTAIPATRASGARLPFSLPWPSASAWICWWNMPLPPVWGRSSPP